MGHREVQLAFSCCGLCSLGTRASLRLCLTMKESIHWEFSVLPVGMVALALIDRLIHSFANSQCMAN